VELFFINQVIFMLKHQLSLLAIATILLSSTLARADDISGGKNLSVGNIQIQASDSGNVSIQTPSINIQTLKSVDGRVISRTRRRSRIPVVRGRVIYSPATLRQRAVVKTTLVEYPDRVHNSTIRTSTNNSQTINEQHVQCHGSGSSSIVQSSQTIDGKTVSSEVHNNCN
jgi:hypothetical protein